MRTGLQPCSPRGGALCPNAFRKRVFRPAVLGEGLDANLTPHELRDTAAKLAFSHGATVKEVQRMRGHAKATARLVRLTDQCGRWPLTCAFFGGR